MVIHKSADVQSLNIGEGCEISQNVTVLSGARIGKFVTINAYCLIENEVMIGDNSIIKSGVYICDKVTIEENVFIGPNVVFTNNNFPRNGCTSKEPFGAIIRKGASVGGGAVVLPCVEIGQNAVIGAGAVVTKSIPANAIAYGNPAKIMGYVNNIQPKNLEFLEGGIDEEAKEVGVRGVSLHKLKIASDIRGSLSVGEVPIDIPFEIKRYFLVYDVPSEKLRGEHAHYKCHQFLICVKGRCSVLVDDGENRSEVLLDSPSKGLYLKPLVWGVQYKYSEDAVLLVFASEYYDSDDYIRSYEEFVYHVKRSV